MNWFFVDPNITNSKTLLSMLAELGYLSDPDNALANAWIGVKSLWHQNLLPLVSAAFLLVTLRFSWQVLMSCGLSIAAVFTFGLLGRPGALHVYIPLISLLIIAPFLIEKLSPWRYYRFETVALVIAAIVNTADVFSESKVFQIAAKQTHKELANFPNYPIVNWGTTFPFESVYPVLVVSPAAMSYQFYSLGSFTLAPFSVAFSEQQHGRGMTDLLIKETGVPIIGYDQYIKYLEIYCKEHFHGQLQELSVKQYGEIVVRQQRCEVKP
jgi:hypothetical protein